MKKIIGGVAAFCLCATLMGCSSAEEAEEQEQEVEQDNAIALSMTYPKSFEAMQYMVAGDWEELSDETQITYYTGYSTILISAVEGEDYESFVSQMLEKEGIFEEATEDPLAEDLPEGEEIEDASEWVPEQIEAGETEGDMPEGSPEGGEPGITEEEIEVDGVSGIKRSQTIDERNIELFTFFEGNKTYCIVVIYSDVSEQGKAYEAIDTLVSSIMFDRMPELDSEEELVIG